MDLKGHLHKLSERLGSELTTKYGLSEPGLASLFEPDIRSYPWTLEANRWASLATSMLQEIGEGDPAPTEAALDELLDLELLDAISSLGPLDGGATSMDNALLAAPLLRRNNDPRAMFFDSVPGGVESKDFYWDVPSDLNGCSLAGAQLTLRRDGSASWRGVVNSIFENDSFCVTMSFLNVGGRTLLEWPRFCSQTLWQSLQVWTNNNLRFPDTLYDSIEIVNRRDHC